MSHDLGELKEYPLRRLDGMPRGVLVAGAALVALGAIGFFLGLADDAARAWRAYTFNWIFFAGVAQGAVLLAAVVAMTRGVWSRPVRRIAVSFVAFLPIAYILLFPPILIWGAEHLFPWLHQDVGEKAIYLNMTFLSLRHLVALAALLLASLLFAYWQLRPDAGAAADAGWDGLDRLTRDWEGAAREREKAERRLGRLAPTLALLYVAAYSLVAFDLVMSLDPHWISTLIGPYVFMAAFLGGIAATAVLTVLYRRPLGLEEYVEGNNIHDLGKLFFAFSIFWAYLFWSQYMVIWYGNLPNEQSFLVNRLSDPYRLLSVFVLFAMFVLPFFGLLGVKPKKTPAIMAGVAAVSLLGLWVERYILVYPTLYPRTDTLVFGLPELAPALGMLGILTLAVVWFATRLPMLQVWQPAREVELLGVEPDEAADRTY